MTPLFIIPARGGSKGIPRKNIKELCGKPLIAYSIEAANQVDPRYVFVSTEDEEIAQVAAAYGAATEYRRPAALATDTAGSREVILDLMDWADRQGISYDCVVLLQPTSPLRTADDIRHCLRLYAENPEADMVVSVKDADCNPYYDCFEADPQSGLLHISKGDGLYTRRQDAPPAYQYNGAVYVIRPESIRQMPLGAFPRRIPYIMPRDRSIDLDTPIDWLMAETIMTRQNG
ncbi:MAG: acylneuraminate cytidylyltransferase family protein [Bacteroidales bacterium]|nr:acylneuraminate cytidylyltransferase family protein [Bacteroidales bacterium]